MMERRAFVQVTAAAGGGLLVGVGVPGCGPSPREDTAADPSGDVSAPTDGSGPSFAIRAATGLAAEIVGLKDRGRLIKGQWADIVILDPRRLRDRATYAHPHRHSHGIEWVLVNGRVAVMDGEPTGTRGGRALLKR